MIRIRLLLAAVMVAAVLIGAVWLFRQSGGNSDALPLVKADLTPVKVEASALDGDDNQKENAPLETSTVFDALAGQPEEAPRLPPADAAKTADTPANPPQFAGFRTGFALPRAEQPKTEQLYGTPEQQPAAAPAPDIAAADATAVEPEPETVPETQPEPAAKDEDAHEWTIRDVIPSALLKNPFKGETAKDMERDERENLAATGGVPPRATNVPPPPDAALRAPEPQEAQADAATAPEPVVTEEAPAPQPENAMPVTGGDYYIQLASTPDMAAAQNTWGDVTRRNPALFSGLEPRFQEADLGRKGKFVRVQAGPLTEREGNRRCAEYKANGMGDCILVKR